MQEQKKGEISTQSQPHKSPPTETSNSLASQPSHQEGQQHATPPLTLLLKCLPRLDLRLHLLHNLLEVTLRVRRQAEDRLVSSEALLALGLRHLGADWP